MFDSLGKLTQDLKVWNKHVYELESILHHGEILWKQKSEMRLVKVWKQEQKFFHTRTLLRKKNNCIISIHNSDGNWTYDPTKDIEDEANKFFQMLYRQIPAPLGKLPHSGFPQLNSVDISFFGRPVSNVEIKDAPFDMAPIKAPDSEGFHALFFKKQWVTIGGGSESGYIWPILTY
ncbi:putative Transposon TX1 [Gossypium australe]|uniref:Putative Transposon TX1 n=1 Tax=Gossypium australe TaxID=47621 RepID=A0A5B6WJN1_9ROSI|nr:putative Transposon TX1 [Gossypium australe]